MRYWSCDFETTTQEDDCRVWLWAARDYYAEKRVWGIDIDSFMRWASEQRVTQLSFHNLKFDGSFIIDYLLKRGYMWVPMDQKKMDPGTFKTLVSDMGQWYFIEIRFMNGVQIKIIDSLKLLPFKVAKIAKDFHLPMLKGKIDYKAYRPRGHKPTKEELEYIFNDVDIVALAMRQMYDSGDDCLTIGACALHNYKEMISEKEFTRLFPVPPYDKDVRQAYRGGWTFANPIFQNQEIGEGRVYDVNSLFPWVMASEDCPLPYGHGMWQKGEIKPDEFYPIFVQHLRCRFELKPHHLPMIQIKGSPMFDGTEYLASSNGAIVNLCLTSVDLQLFKDHYELYDVEYISGWKFHAKPALFKGYVEFWTQKKVQAKKEKNFAMYILAKLHLNSLYGKTGSSPRADVKVPTLSESGAVKWHISHEPEKTPVYIPAAVFITAYARNKTVRAAQSVFDRFLYADTDSIHVVGDYPVEGIEVDSFKLGAWDHEMSFKRGKYIHAKCYIEEGYCVEEQETDYKGDPVFEDEEETIPKMKKVLVNYKTDLTKLKVTIAGLPEDCHSQVTWENFGMGTTYDKKLKPKIVPGGTILDETKFKIKEKFY